MWQEEGCITYDKFFAGHNFVSGRRTLKPKKPLKPTKNKTKPKNLKPKNFFLKKT